MDELTRRPVANHDKNFAISGAPIVEGCFLSLMRMPGQSAKMLSPDPGVTAGRTDSIHQFTNSPIHQFTNCDYSPLRAIIGSTLVARRAGM